jgi:hypothetical protein
MLCDSHHFYSVFRQADEKGAIFFVYSERVDQAMLRFQQLGVKRWMGRIVLKKHLGLFPLPDESMLAEIPYDIFPEIKELRH